MISSVNHLRRLIFVFSNPILFMFTTIKTNYFRLYLNYYLYTLGLTVACPEREVRGNNLSPLIALKIQHILCVL